MTSDSADLQKSSLNPDSLESLRRVGLDEELLRFLLDRLAVEPIDPATTDTVWQRLCRFLLAARSPLALTLLLRRDVDSLDALLRLLESSAWLAECLIADPEAFDLLRMTGGRPIDRAVLVDEINAEVHAAGSLGGVETILRRHRRRETLRIAYGDLILNQPLEQTNEQLTFVADAILNAAITAVRRLQPPRRGDSRAETRGSQLCCLATGAYGAGELDYGDTLDVLWLYRPEARAEPSDAGNCEQHWVEQVIALLAAADHLGPTYDLQIKPRADSDPAVLLDAEQWLRVVDRSGRTWLRQEFIKTRFAAGDAELGEWLTERLQPWIYRRFLGWVDQAGIRSLKRKLTKSVHRWDELATTATATPSVEADELNELTRQAIADIERVVRFLQLLNGSDLPQLRVANTRLAIEQLERAGCLTMRERTLLLEHYRDLQKHRLQLQLRSKYNTITESADSIADRLADCVDRRAACQPIIDHLMQEVFIDAEEIPVETEMVLDPDFDYGQATEVLTGYGFTRPQTGLPKLLSLATESIRFLSDRRGRHFLAGIAPPLLTEISTTPDPDATLDRFAAISDSLGGKAALFELFQTNPSTLKLCIRLCATSPYLTNLLVSNPGMLDELMDSLLLDRLPQGDELERGSVELCRFAEDIEPILQSFKNSAHLRIGVRDILGRDRIEDTHRALADVADACLRRAAEDATEQMLNRYGQPFDENGREVQLSMLALGKLGGREPNYHSDLDILFIYDADGHTRPLAGGAREGTTNSHFFHELTQRISKRINHYTPYGRLYELDARIRFSHERGMMAVTVEQFEHHFTGISCPLWQCLALINARLISASAEARPRIEGAVFRALQSPRWTPEMATEAAALRAQSERGAAPGNLKRGSGGTMDVEAIVRMLLLKHAVDILAKPNSEEACGGGTLDGLEKLSRGGWLDTDQAEQLAIGYRYLRSVESYLRLMDLPARHDLPDASNELRWLAYAMRETDANVVAQKCGAFRETNRQLLNQIFAEESSQNHSATRLS